MTRRGREKRGNGEREDKINREKKEWIKEEEKGRIPIFGLDLSWLTRYDISCPARSSTIAPD